MNTWPQANPTPTIPTTDIDAKQLVPGDIVVPESGDRISADVRFLELSDLHVDE